MLFRLQVFDVKENYTYFVHTLRVYEYNEEILVRNAI